MKIAVVGLGYVGTSISVLLAQHCEVVALDICPDRVADINSKKSPISDPDLEKYLFKHDLNLVATTCDYKAFDGANYVVIATPTNFDEETGLFNTSSVEKVISQISANYPKATIVVKSTIPVGFIKRMRIKYEMNRIMFSPEFLREGRSLYDNLYPSRIVIGDDSPEAQTFANLLLKGAIKKDVSVQFTAADEAEAIKLFSNTYLAMRIAYFNELDTYAMSKNLDSEAIINGVCHDPRIGLHYNNPSFGYGGYCLPKDTKQLLSDYEEVPQDLIRAVVNSNSTRKNFIANQIIKMSPIVVGVYRLSMKAGSDNFRQSSILEIMTKIIMAKIRVIVFEPSIQEQEFHKCYVEKNLNKFKRDADLIITNRVDADISDVKHKLFTRDIFSRD